MNVELAQYKIYLHFTDYNDQTVFCVEKYHVDDSNPYISKFVLTEKDLFSFVFSRGFLLKETDYYSIPPIDFGDQVKIIIPLSDDYYAYYVEVPQLDNPKLHHPAVINLYDKEKTYTVGTKESFLDFIKRAIKTTTNSWNVCLKQEEDVHISDMLLINELMVR